MRHLLIRALGARGQRPPDELDQDLVRCDAGLEGTLEEPVERHGPVAPRRPQHGRVVEGQQERRQVGRRVGVADRPTDRAPVADLDIADAEDAFAGEVELGRLERLGVRRQRTDLPATIRGRARRP